MSRSTQFRWGTLFLVSASAVLLSIAVAFSVLTLLVIVAFGLMGIGILVTASIATQLLCLAAAWLGRITRRQGAPAYVGGNSAKATTGSRDIEVAIAAAETIPATDANSSIRFLDPSIEDADVAGIAELGELKWLVLDNTNVSDVGLAFLHRLTKLRRLYVRGSRVTAEGVRRLQLALPNVKVVLH